MSNVQKILDQLSEIGPVLPGKLELHYNVCGKSGCRCKDPQNPVKHGPYYRLSYSLNGKNTSVFVKKEDAGTVEKMTDNYKKLRTLTMELSLAYVEEFKQSGINKDSCSNGILSDKAKQISHESYQKKAQLLQAAQVKINDLTKSRNSWKHKYEELKEKSNYDHNKPLVKQGENLPVEEKKN